MNTTFIGLLLVACWWKFTIHLGHAGQSLNYLKITGGLAAVTDPPTMTAKVKSNNSRRATNSNVDATCAPRDVSR